MERIVLFKVKVWSLRVRMWEAKIFVLGAMIIHEQIRSVVGRQRCKFLVFRAIGIL